MHGTLDSIGTAGGELRAALRAHAAAWSRCAGVAALPTQHPGFLAALGASYLADSRLWAVRVGSPAAPDAVAVLCRDDDRLARWRLAGDREVHEPGCAVYADEAAAQALADAICAQHRAVEFTRLPEGSPLIAAFERAALHRGVLLQRRAVPSPTLALDAGWADPLSRLSSRRRSDLRRARRKADEMGTVTFAMEVPGPCDFEALFAEAVAVEAKSWKHGAGAAILCDPVKHAFFAHYLGGAARRGEARIATMRVDGVLVAMQLAVVWNGAYWLYKIGFDEAYARCSPGQLLMAFAIGAAAREGLANFEMMGEADDWIADLWTDAARECVRLRFYPRSTAGMAALVADGAEWFGTRAARRWARWRRAA